MEMAYTPVAQFKKKLGPKKGPPVKKKTFNGKTFPLLSPF